MRIAPAGLVLGGTVALLSAIGAPGVAARPQAGPPSSARVIVTTTPIAPAASVVPDNASANITVETAPDESPASEPRTPETQVKVQEPRIRWQSPRPNTVLFRPGRATLQWASTCPEGTGYTVTLSRDGRTFNTVVARWQNDTETAWTLPDLPVTDYYLRVKAMSPTGELLDDDVIPVHVLPEDLIVISKQNQALWAFQDGQLQSRFTISTGRKSNETREGWFTVYNREPDHYSRLYDAPMPFSLFFSGGMAMHASTLVKQLGTPASHGCVRLRYDDARRLFSASQVGRPVLVTGWGRDMGYLDAVLDANTRTAQRDSE